MILKPITKLNFYKFYKLLASDFCYDERKSESDEFLSLSDKRFSPNFIYLNNKLIGYICFWEFDDFIFIEHFAILKIFRNKGLGSEFLTKFSEKQSKPIVLEAEKDLSDQSKSRIQFYTKNNYKINSNDYIQPNYSEDSKPVPMHILSYKSKLSNENFKKFVFDIKKIVKSINKIEDNMDN